MKRVASVVAAATLVTVTTVLLSGCQATSIVSSDSSEPTTAGPAQKDEPTEERSAHAWADRTFGSFDAFTVTGSGADRIVFPDDAKSGFYTIEWAPGHWVNEDSHAQVYGEDGSSHDAGIADYPGDSASVAYGVEPTVAPAGWIGIEAGAGDWTITVSPISSLPALPGVGGYDAYLYGGDEKEVVFSSTNAGRVKIRQFNGVDASNRILPQEDFTATGTLLAGPSVVNVHLETLSPWTRSTS